MTGVERKRWCERRMSRSVRCGGGGNGGLEYSVVCAVAWERCRAYAEVGARDCRKALDCGGGGGGGGGIAALVGTWGAASA